MFDILLSLGEEHIFRRERGKRGRNDLQRRKIGYLRKLYNNNHSIKSWLLHQQTGHLQISLESE